MPFARKVNSTMLILGTLELRNLGTWELATHFWHHAEQFPVSSNFFLFVPVFFFSFHIPLFQHLQISYNLLVLIFLSSSFSFLILGTWWIHALHDFK